MAIKYFVKFDGEYLCSDGEGGMFTSPNIDEAGFFDTAERANETALGFSKDGWEIEIKNVLDFTIPPPSRQVGE